MDRIQYRYSLRAHGYDWQVFDLLAQETVYASTDYEAARELQDILNVDSGEARDAGEVLQHHRS